MAPTKDISRGKSLWLHLPQSCIPVGDLLRRRAAAARPSVFRTSEGRVPPSGRRSRSSVGPKVAFRGGGTCLKSSAPRPGFRLSHHTQTTNGRPVDPAPSLSKTVYHRAEAAYGGCGAWLGALEHSHGYSGASGECKTGVVWRFVAQVLIHLHAGGT